MERELADDYRRAGMLAEAADTYRPLAGSDSLAAQGLRDVLVAQGRLGEAIEVHARDCPPDRRVMAHLLASKARATAGAESLAAARSAVETDPSCADALMARAEAEAAIGAGEAAETARLALRAEPAAALLAWPALSALPAGRALEAVDGVLAERAGDPRLLLLRGRLLYEAGRPAEALADLRRAMERDEDGEATLALRELLREARAPSPSELAARHDLVVAALVRQARLLRCRSCRAGASVRAFRCPRCGAFDAYP